MSVYAVMGLFLVLLVWGLIYTKFSRHRLDPVALFCYAFFWFYLFRDVVITLGLDSPYSGSLFMPGETEGLLLKASLILTCFLVAFVGGYLIPLPANWKMTRLVPVARGEPTVQRQFRLVLVLTAVGTVIAVLLVVHYHGIGGAIRAAKVGKQLGGLSALKAIPGVGAVVGSALILTLWQSRRQGMGLSRRRLGISLVATSLDAGYVMLWGSRTVVALVLAIFVAGQWMLPRVRAAKRAEPMSRRKSRPRPMRVLVLGAILLGAIIGLHFVRAGITGTNPSPNSQRLSILQSVSVSTNSIYFDSSLLAFRDWPASYPYRGGEDFLLGLEATVPRKMWPGKPQEVLVGQWFRQVYQPQAENGWPLGAVGDWYLNFGWIGVLIGGAVSGFLYRRMMRAWWSATWTPFTLAAVLCVVMFVVPMGFEADTPANWVQWAFPLLLCARYLRERHRASSVPVDVQIRPAVSDGLASRSAAN